MPVLIYLDALPRLRYPFRMTTELHSNSDLGAIQAATEALVALDWRVWLPTAENSIQGDLLTVAELLTIASLSFWAKPTQLPATVGNLNARGIITDDEITTAANAYLADSKARPFRFASGHTLDVAAVIAAAPLLGLVLADPNVREKTRLVVVHTAIIHSLPTEA